MTQPCDSCGQPSETPTCLACQSSMQRLGSGDADRRLAQRIAQTRAHLTDLPRLVAELARCITEPIPQDMQSGSGGGKPSSKPPMRLDVVHLVDTREKPLWWGEDPRDAELGDRYGVLYQLHSWSRVVWEEMPDAEYLADEPTVSGEAEYLLRALPFINQQQWANDFCDDVISLAGKVRNALGIRREHKPKCRYCHDVVEPVDTNHVTTNWEAYAYALCRGCNWKYEPGAELKALGQVQPAVTIKDLSETTGIPLPTLYRWVEQGVITPCAESPKKPTNRKPALFDLAEVSERIARVRAA